MGQTDRSRGSTITADDEAAVRRAVLDYFEGWFEGDPARMERALHPELAKRCLGGDRRWWSGETELKGLDSTSAEEMIDATARGVGKTRLRPGQDPGIEVEIEDVYDTIANVTVRSAVYHEYVHLIQTGGGWKIVNTVWQRVAEGGGAPE
jgi:putative lumazine-binding protein